MSQQRGSNGQDGKSENGPYQLLAQFEARERTWKESEELLQRIIQRLSLAAQGGSPELDLQLEALREALRGGGREALQSSSEALFRTLMTLEETGRTSVKDPLLRLLGGLRPSDARSKDLQSVVDLVHQAATTGELTHAVREGTDLLNHMLRANPAPVEPPPAPAPARKQPRGGFLAGLLGRSGTSAGGEAPDTAELLLQMLEQIPFPPEATDALNEIKGQLETRPGPERMNVLAGDIALLIDAMRRRERKEREDLEGFLAVLTERLHEIDQAVADVQVARDESASSSEQLDANVRDQVEEIRATVHAGGGLDQMKRTIQGRLEIIQNHLTRFRELDSEYHERLGNQVEQLTHRLHTLESETEVLRHRVQEKQRQALQDVLTGISNRLAFEEHFKAEQARQRRFGHPLSLVFMDVDRFKGINDTYGHKAGDKVLRTVASLLAGRMRETDFVARLGGEEFVVLMPGTDAAAAVPVAEELRNMVAECGFHFRDQRVQVTISCGVAGYRPEDSLESLLERADQAMYRAKQAGRNRTVSAG